MQLPGICYELYLGTYECKAEGHIQIQGMLTKLVSIAIISHLIRRNLTHKLNVNVCHRIPRIMSNYILGKKNALEVKGPLPFFLETLTVPQDIIHHGSAL